MRPKNNTEIGFRLSPNEDPEERLEEALLWKLMHDHFGDRIGLIEDPVDSDIPTFGRGPRTADFATRAINPVSSKLPYWNDPAFLSHCGRRFRTVTLEQLDEAVADIHRLGTATLVKSTRDKHHIQIVPIGQRGSTALGDMAFSFMDGGPDLMVQEVRPMTYEFRFFVIDRRIVTRSPQLESLTPFDFPRIGVTGFKSRKDETSGSDCGRLIGRYNYLVEQIARTMQTPDAVVDVALFSTGDIGVVEFNPMQLGQVGLFACDARALVEMSDALVAAYHARRATEPDDTGAATNDEEDWVDSHRL